MLYYIHGYESSPNSAKGKLLKEKLGVIPIRYREGNRVVISECLKRIEETIDGDDDVTLIGSSFGGLLAAKLALKNHSIKRLILINPAIIPPDENIDVLPVPKEVAKDMQDDGLFTRKIDADIFIIMSTEDELIPKSWVLEFSMAQEATVKFLHDDHRLTRNIGKLPDIISRFRLCSYP